MALGGLELGGMIVSVCACVADLGRHHSDNSQLMEEGQRIERIFFFLLFGECYHIGLGVRFACPAAIGRNPVSSQLSENPWRLYLIRGVGDRSFCPVFGIQR